MAIIRDDILPFRRQRAFSSEQTPGCFFQPWQEFLRESCFQITFLCIVLDPEDGEGGGAWPLSDLVSSHLFS